MQALYTETVEKAGATAVFLVDEGSCKKDCGKGIAG